MCSREGGTHNVWCTGSVCVRGRVGVASAFAVARARQLWRFGGVPFVNDQVDGHFTLKTGDVPMAEVVTQFVDLRSELIHIFFLVDDGGWEGYYLCKRTKQPAGTNRFGINGKRRQRDGKRERKHMLEYC